MADILASDINTIRQKTIDVLGTGAASFGYGQNVYSSAVSAGQLILKSQWDAVRYDIVNCWIHQTGNNPSAVLVNAGDLISDDPGEALANYDFYADTIRNNRFDVATGQYQITAIDTKTDVGTWSTTAESTLTITFTTADEARFFFNSGGAIRIGSSFTPGTGATSQSNAWANLLSTAGDQDFSGDLIAATGFYTLTNTFQEYYQTSASTPYSANAYSLQAKCDVADNSNGTATEVTIRIYLNDSYVDPGAPAPGDQVDGTLTITAEELRAVGTLQPLSTPFVITAPTYSMSNITTT
jgi:hypothetical protein